MNKKRNATENKELHKFFERNQSPEFRLFIADKLEHAIKSSAGLRKDDELILLKFCTDIRKGMGARVWNFYYNELPNSCEYFKNYSAQSAIDAAVECALLFIAPLEDLRLVQVQNFEKDFTFFIEYCVSAEYYGDPNIVPDSYDLEQIENDAVRQAWRDFNKLWEVR